MWSWVFRTRTRICQATKAPYILRHRVRNRSRQPWFRKSFSLSNKFQHFPHWYLPKQNWGLIFRLQNIVDMSVQIVLQPVKQTWQINRMCLIQIFGNKKQGREALRVSRIESIVQPGFPLWLAVLFQAVERSDAAGRGTVAGYWQLAAATGIYQ
jgi:hypothetical protein